MKKYELMTIINADLKEDGAKKVLTNVKAVIEDLKGTVGKVESWGKKKFAYKIKHLTQGYYDLVMFEAEPAVLAELKKRLNYFDGLVRYLITAKE